MYNQKYKNTFLDYVSKDKNMATYKNVIYELFEYSEPIEMSKNKDISKFEKEEVLDFLKTLKIPTYVMVSRRIWAINRYIEWLSKRTGVNISSPTYTKKELEDVSVGVFSWTYLEPDSVCDICKQLPSATGFILYASYVGAGGPSLVEITSMKMKDIDQAKKKVKLYTMDSDGNRTFTREIPVDDQFIYFAEKANNEIGYYDNAGKLLGHLESSQYILKRREGSSGGADIVQSKYKMCRDKIINAQKRISVHHLSISTFKYSGVINYLIDVINKLGLEFDQETLCLKDNELLLKRACDIYYIKKATMKRIITEYFEMII